jgi:hypothetical protein
VSRGTIIFVERFFMPRKRWVQKTEITPSLIRFREKRKWQIALRRYVIEKNLCSFYAPFFALDINTIRNWFECQFVTGTLWSDFGKTWQFDHIIPVAYFDFSLDEELKMCWNFTNLRVDYFKLNKERGSRIDALAAKGYFKKLYEKTRYAPCLKLLHKIDTIELSEIVSSEKQQLFIRSNKDYLDMLENCSAFEFELLNSGRSIAEVKEEISFLRKFNS